MVTIKVSEKWEIVCKIEHLVWIAIILEDSPSVTEFEVWQAGCRLDKNKAGYCGFSKWKQ
jgi:hypothetical protein